VPKATNRGTVASGETLRWSWPLNWWCKWMIEWKCDDSPLIAKRAQMQTNWAGLSADRTARNCLQGLQYGYEYGYGYGYYGVFSSQLMGLNRLWRSLLGIQIYLIPDTWVNWQTDKHETFVSSSFEFVWSAKRSVNGRIDDVADWMA